MMSVQGAVDTLSQAKDKAQITAAAAMCVVKVGLLKEILNHGPNNNPYYTFLLSLISVALFLQIVAGVIALVLGSINAYHAKHGTNICREFSKHLCGCTIVAPPGEETRCSKMCPCRITCQVLDDHEISILREYDAQKAQLFQLKLKNLAVDTDPTPSDIKLQLDMKEKLVAYLEVESRQVRHNRIMKLTTFWQHMINYIFYIVFVLDIFITGFGIAGVTGVNGIKAQDVTNAQP